MEYSGCEARHINRRVHNGGDFDLFLKFLHALLVPLPPCGASSSLSFPDRLFVVLIRGDRLDLLDLIDRGLWSLVLNDALLAVDSLCVHDISQPMGLIQWNISPGSEKCVTICFHDMFVH